MRSGSNSRVIRSMASGRQSGVVVMEASMSLVYRMKGEHPMASLVFKKPPCFQAAARSIFSTNHLFKIASPLRSAGQPALRFSYHLPRRPDVALFGVGLADAQAQGVAAVEHGVG